MQKIFLYKGREKGRKVTEEFVMVSDEDYEYLNKYQWGLMKIYHCDTPIKYARRYEGGIGNFKAILMHRVILGLTDKSQKGDHIDGNGLNCQRNNLRVCTHSQNMSRKVNRKGINKCGFLGVSFDGKNYGVHCKHNGKNYRLTGSFPTAIEAAIGYNYLAFSIKGEYALLNDIYKQ